MTDLELLASFPATGDDGPVLNDWEAAEAALNTTFPPSFKRFLGVFGGAKFDDFLRVYRAGAENEHVDLIERTLAARKTMGDSRPHIQSLLDDRGVKPSQLIRWGGTDNADLLFLIPHVEPDEWAVLTVIGRGREYDLYEGSVESYLLRVLRGDLVSEVFPEDFPDEEPSFERNPWI
ncbi:hypothetical protein BX264_1805 [Streptomyces sp. 2333.5]|uniref:SMI1/KNR4 family protein n=1 Tax=unclassified Streptomyces TaxID=2593676 RepID=UPI000896E8E9|nr:MULTISPECIES: SMI1/KNR4 family protein [unclassified Streptomyces]PJJ01498.1 hypothetical protein BX264_1805 [Streptomyces sp. 2333.5]SED43579.1 hypothetical protein SAMN05428942_1821 [Streptomyces sp. 2112.2]